MAAKPILFSGPMIRLILEGRKTQTRRVIKPQPPFYGNRAAPSGIPGHWDFWSTKYPKASLRNMPLTCPYGQKGTVLWVREGFRWSGGGSAGFNVIYRADNTCRKLKAECGAIEKTSWQPSIHMPRASSRINLLVKDIRVERVQEITPEDAIAEGLLSRCGDVHPGLMEYSCGDGFWTTKPRTAFIRLWDSINGNRKDKSGNRLPYSWSDNPMVWVGEFEEWQDH